MSQHLILVVDDESSILNMVKMALELDGYRVITADSAALAHSLIHDHQPDLLLLDWMMPGTSGLELLRRLRRQDDTANLPVIMLTAKTTEESQITGLDAGADDYIAKPFSPRELGARIRAVLRRTGSSKDAASALLIAGPLTIDVDSHRVTIAEQPVILAPTEYRLLQFFMQNPERVYTRDNIMDQVWGNNIYLDERTVDVHIRRLRKAISLLDCDKFIQTVRGTGYRFSPQL